MIFGYDIGENVAAKQALGGRDCESRKKYMFTGWDRNPRYDTGSDQLYVAGRGFLLRWRGTIRSQRPMDAL